MDTSAYPAVMEEAFSELVGMKGIIKVTLRVHTSHSWIADQGKYELLYPCPSLDLGM
jgi:hypothetical protein